MCRRSSVRCHSWLPVSAVVLALCHGCTRGPEGAASVEKAGEGEPNLVVEVRAAPGGEILKLDAVEVRRARPPGKEEQEEGEVVASEAFTNGPVRFTLDPGRYVVRAGSGVVTGELPVEVKRGQRGTYHLLLDAGWVRVRVLPKEGTDPVPTWIQALREVHDEAGEKTREVVTEVFASDGTHRFFLPAGAYLIRAKDDPAVAAEVPVQVRAGVLEQAVVVLRAGWLKATAVAKERGDPLPKVWLHVQRQTRDTAGEEAWTTVAEAFTHEGRHRFFLPAGSYRVLAKREAASATAPATVNAGALSEVTVNLNAGWANVRVVKEAGGTTSPDQRIWIQREGHDEAGAPRWETVAEAFATQGTHRFFVPAGTYRATAEGASLTGTAPLTVTPGARTEVEVVASPPRP